MLILVVGSGGCGKAGNTSSLSMSSYPHQNGNQWECKTTLTVGNSVNSTSIMKRYFDGETTLSNGLVAQNLCTSYETSSAGVMAIKRIKLFASPSSTSLYCVTGTGVYNYGTITYPTTEAAYLLPLPLDVGDIWTIVENLTCEVIGEEEITVPAGTFRTLKVEVNIFGSSGADQSDYYEWYADGVGLVKSSFSFLTLSSTIEGGRVILSTIEVESSLVEELVSKNF